jgi:outer membrane protein TolC
LQLEKNQYQAGIVDYASVLTSDITLLNAEKIANDAIGQSMVSAVTLIMALGGGWHEAVSCNPS